MDAENTIKVIIDAAITVKRVLGHGFLESVYQRALLYELKLRGLEAQIEVPVEVHYKCVVVGSFRADILVENSIIVELKVAENIDLAHEYQLVNYLKATDIDHGLIINFGQTPIGIKRKYRNCIV